MKNFTERKDYRPTKSNFNPATSKPNKFRLKYILWRLKHLFLYERRNLK